MAVLAPVVLGGTTIQRSTLHNEDEIRRRDVRVGDVVLIEKGGDVIPKIVKSFPESRGGDSKPFVWPDRCPACGSEIVREEGEAVWRCLNVSCPARLKESLLHFAGRGALDIAGLGEALVDQLLARGLVHDFADLYRLDENTLADLERMGKKSAVNLTAQIERSRDASLDRVLYGLGIRFIGERTAAILAGQFPSIDALMEARLEDLTRVPEVGERVGEAIRQFFERPENRALVGRLKEAGLRMPPAPREVRAGGGPWSGRTVVITGTFPGFPRETIKKMIRSGGGRVTEGLSKSTTLLLAGADPGSKLEKARRLGVQVMETEEFQAVAGAED
jgi:DNA ligase (NAD+)